MTRPDQSAVGDQGNAMTIGYQAAALRIEMEIGSPRCPVLDVGCNSGAGMAYLKTRWPNAEIYGIEPVEKFAHAARAKGLNVATAAASRIPFSDGFFGLVFSRHSLEHVEFRRIATEEIARIMRPGGHIYVQAPIEPGGSKNKLHLSPFGSAEELRSAFLGLFDEVYFGPQATVAEFIGRRRTNV